MPLQQSASTHAVQLASSITSVSGPQQRPLISTLDVGAEPFVPQPGSVRVDGRDTADILRDHSEVERVLLGGVGTHSASAESWFTGTYQPKVQTCAINTDTPASLPFAACEIPTGFTVPAKPVAKTGSLQEFSIKFGDRVFVDRLLPQPSKPLRPHPRFTTTYYVALHNLVAGSGHDGNGFQYPANTPNFRGARIPLAHTV